MFTSALRQTIKMPYVQISYNDVTPDYTIKYVHLFNYINYNITHVTVYNSCNHGISAVFKMTMVFLTPTSDRPGLRILYFTVALF